MKALNVRKNLSCERVCVRAQEYTRCVSYRWIFIKTNQNALEWTNERDKRNCVKVRLEFELMQLNAIDLFACWHRFFVTAGIANRVETLSIELEQRDFKSKFYWSNDHWVGT